MALYEITFIVRQDNTEQEVQKLSESVKEYIVNEKGKILKEEFWGLRSLAYRIKKNRKGHYIHLGVETNGEVIKEINRRFRINENILRDLVVKVEEISKEPSSIMKAKAA